MKVNVKLDEGAMMLERAHPTDAGADIRTPHDVTVPAHGSATVDTGIHVEVPDGYCGLLVSKSGLNVKHGILSDGLIDQGYDGSIVVKLYNHGDVAVTLLRGSKVSQLVLLPVLYAGFEQVDEIAGGPRGSNGFGSTNLF